MPQRTCGRIFRAIAVPRDAVAVLCWFFHELEGAVWKTADEIAGVNSNTGSH